MMLDHVDEAMENGAAGFSTGLFYPTNAGGGHRRGFACRGALRQPRRRLRDAYAQRDGAGARLDRRDAGDRQPRRHPRRHLASQMRRTRGTGAARGRRCRRSRPRQNASRSGSTPIPTPPARPTSAPDLVTDEYPDHDHLVAAAPGDDRPRPRRHRQGMGCRHSRRGEAARSGRRDLLPDGRGRCAPRAALFRSP